MSIASEAPSILTSALARLRASVASLRARVILAVGGLALVVLATLGWLGGREITRFLDEQADVRLHDAARRSALILESILLEREREIAILSSSPMIADAARMGTRTAAELGLDDIPHDSLEQLYREERSLQVDARIRQYLRNLLPKLGIAEILLTEASGLNALTSSRTSDFVQRDEEWWTQAMRDGIAPLTAVYDQSARQVVISLAAAVRERPQAAPAGAIKVSFGLAKIDSTLRALSAIAGIQVDLIDASGRVIASSGPLSRLQMLPGADRLIGAPGDSIIAYGIPSSDGGVQRRRAALDALHTGGWRLVAHMDEDVLTHQRRQALSALLTVTGALFLLILATLFYLGRALNERVSRPAAELAVAAETVAAGDLSVEIAPNGNEDEIGRLTRATRSMIADLRRLAETIRDASGQTSTMATEITLGSEHMAAAAQEMAAMSSDLSHQSTEMADSIRHLADDAGELVAIASALEAGAEEGVTRNSRLRSLAGENRQRLDESARALEAMAADARTTVEANEALTAASEEIRAFVVLVQKIARQSKLLALNAAMEAARAGEEGDGFAVVAGEVRRLSAAASDGAERTEAVVAQVLKRVAESRDASVRTSETMQKVLAATQQGHASFGQVEAAVGDTESWTATIADAAHRTSEHVQEMTGRIEMLAKGTEVFAAAMEQVAASSQEQSASTEEIAAAAERLTSAAERLTAIVATFRLERRNTAEIPVVAETDHATTGAENGVLSPQLSAVSVT